MTLADLRRVAELLPHSASITLARAELLALLEDQEATSGPAPAPVRGDASAPRSWQERLWTAPAETRLTVADVCEALGRPKSWAYRHTSPASGLPRIPHRKLDGELVFLAGELREWIKSHEDIVVKHVNVTPIHRARRAAVATTGDRREG